MWKQIEGAKERFAGKSWLVFDPTHGQVVARAERMRGGGIEWTPVGGVATFRVYAPTHYLPNPAP